MLRNAFDCSRSYLKLLAAIYLPELLGLYTAEVLIDPLASPL